MLLKILTPWLITCTLLVSGNLAGSAQEKGSGFSLRELFGISKKSEGILIDEHVNLGSLSNWTSEVQKFYSNRKFQPVWFNNNGLNRKGKELMKELKTSWEAGLPEPVVFLAQAEEAMLSLNRRSANEVPLAQIISEADVNLTLAWFDHASQISTGILNPKELNIVWEILPDETDLVNHLQSAIEKGNIAESFNNLEPRHEQYKLLLKEFHYLTAEQQNGGWPLPGDVPPLKTDDSHPGVTGLKKYLYATGDLQNNDDEYLKSVRYDDELAAAVKNFQHRHGLLADGIAGDNTLRQMNVPLEYRINQIRLNIDRIRWLPPDFGNNHIVINIPDFSFKYHKNSEPVKEMNVVVGNNENYTPVLEDTLYSVIFNPTWNVPNSIATKEIFPGMLNDTTYMERNNYSILKSSYVSKDTIDYKSYDWTEVPRDSFPFFVVQHPGPTNSLGRLQFMLQNQYSIFLHDTPAHHLFDIEQRDFSHGCVRLERPAELAVTLLRDQLPNDSIIKFLSEKEKRVVYLDEKIPVHLIYQTTWVDETGKLNFREDIYGFDELAMPLLERSFPVMAIRKKPDL